jgi:hypothetical protein
VIGHSKAGEARVMRDAETVLGVLRSHWRARCWESQHGGFGGGLRGKGPESSGTSPCGLPCAGLPEAESPEDAKIPSAGKTPVTGAAPCVGVPALPMQLPECGAMSSEDIQGDESAA